MQLFQPLLTARTVEIDRGAQRGGERIEAARFGRNHLSRVQPGDLSAQRVRVGFDHLEPAGRNIRRRDRNGTARFADRDAPVRAAAVEQRFLGQRARRYHANDRAVDQRFRSGALLRFFGCFDLIGDRDAVACLDQPGEIRLCRMRGHAAHRDLFAVMLASRGQRDVEARSSDLRIVEEKFEKVAHAIEEQAIAGLFLQLQILGHHRGRCGHRRQR